MIHTSYFSNIRKLPEHLVPISISRFPPSWYKGETDLTLAPSEELLLGYKEGKIDELEYEKQYREQLAELKPNEVAKKFDGHVLCCFEKTGEFCHRHILAEWLQENGYKIAEKTKLDVGVIGSKNFSDYEYMKYRLGQLSAAYPNMGFKVITGTSRGTDRLAQRWAEENGIEKVVFSNQWNRDGKSSPNVRRETVVGASDIIVAFWDGESEHIRELIEQATEEGKTVYAYKMGEKKFNVETQKDFSAGTSASKIYVFGDNLERKGSGEHAEIRDEPNARGVATKRRPTKTKDAYFTGTAEELEAVKTDLREIYKLGMSGKTIVFPEDGLGTGVSELSKKSPEIYRELDSIIDIFFGMKNVSGEFSR